ncbi:RNA recognition family protein [Cryptosporidium andersoni]|uniref:RNA recognition family protein n=1 Tax=Cryptosporidium andersoni TaxID=117008 RepID=A0A1J4MYE9_9CRYT|nr:RNA recognition family protein [Cryptosporidium andersoni]
MTEIKKRGRKPLAKSTEEDSSDSQQLHNKEESAALSAESEASEHIQEISTASNNDISSANENSGSTSASDQKCNDPSSTLYVCRLSLRTKEDDLRRLFEDYGRVTDCRLVTNPLSGESRCFGFVTMSCPEEAARARDALDCKEYQDANLKVEMARRAKPYEPTPGEYKGPQYRSIKYNSSSRNGPSRSYRGHSSRPSSRSRYDYPPQSSSHTRTEQYNRHDDYYNSRYSDHRYPSRSDDYHHPSRYHSPPRYSSRADPYDSRYSRR